MNTVKAYYDGVTFMPMELCDTPKDSVVKLSISREDAADSNIARKLAAFQKITRELRELNKIEPLPPDFDDIMSRSY